MMVIPLSAHKLYQDFHTRPLGTLNTHFEEITNYFVDRQTSGFVEGLNNKIKVLKRRCYGITNLTHLYQRVCLDLNGYARFGIET